LTKQRLDFELLELKYLISLRPEENRPELNIPGFKKYITMCIQISQFEIKLMEYNKPLP
jgi:hypothetical protein